MPTTFIPSRKDIVIYTILVLFALPICRLWATDTWTSNTNRSGKNISYNETTKTYTIYKCAELAWLADQVNGGNTFAGYTFVLGDNLDLNNLPWTPIGYYTSSYDNSFFQGTFDGNNKIISNVTINTTDDYVGLFGIIQNNQGTGIKNLKVVNVNITGDQYVGGLVGYVYLRTGITGCSVSGVVTSSTNATSSYTGGLIGYFDTNNWGSVTVSDCSSSANVISSQKKDNIGGLIGDIPNGVVNITNCYATGNITGGDYSGGFIGQIEGGASISNCFASGSIVASGNNLGGFLGAWTGNAGGSGISNSYATGSVTGSNSKYVGGFIGYYNQWYAIQSCYATGAVTGLSDTNGFIGRCDGGTINSCYYDIQGTGQSSSGYSSGITGLSTSALCSQTISGFTNTTGYYPQITNLYNSTDAAKKAWSAISVVPLNLNSADNSLNVNYNFTAPLTSAATTGSNLTWNNQSPSGMLAFSSGNTAENIKLLNLGGVTFTTTDANGYSKSFYININNVPTPSFWYKADGATAFNGTTWPDESGATNDASVLTTGTGTVTLANNTINFNPSIAFTNTYQQVITKNSANIKSFIAVTLPNISGTTTPHLGGLIGSSSDNGIRVGITTSPYNWQGDNNSNDWGYGGSSWINGNSKDLTQTSFSGWHIVAQTRSTSLSSKYYLGGYFKNNDNRTFTGQIAEVMAFVNNINTNRNSIETYLAIKYGITLGHDYYDGNGNNIYSILTYNNNIAGLGYDTSYGLNQQVSASINLPLGTSSRVVMSTSGDFTSANPGRTTPLTNGQYLIWGDNGGDATSWSTPSATTGVFPVVSRMWKVQNTNNVGNINLQIDLTGYPSSTTYAILIDNDGDLTNGGMTEYPLTQSSGNLYTASIPFPSGTSYFTITNTVYKNAIYVRKYDYNGTATNDGTSWANALQTIQRAVEISNNLATKLPVYVAAGSYSGDPNYASGDYATYSNGPWNGWKNNFVIRSGVNVYGSFPEYGTTNNNNADMTSRVVLSEATQYATTLNGGTDTRALGPSFASTPLGGGTTGLSTSTIWDGFIITGANMQHCNSNQDDVCGGGVYTLPNFTLSNCIIESNSTSNSTTNDGSGAEMDGGTLYNCIIRNNTTGSGSGSNSNAGSINVRSGGSNIINCLIYGNYAFYAGGGISISLYNNSSTNCYFINNTIANNTAANRSSGIHIFGNSNVLYFYNNAIYNNTVSGVTQSNEQNNAWPSGYGTSSLGLGSMVLDASNVPPATTGSVYFPKFANPTTDIAADYRLQTSSSLINAGIASVSGAPTFPTTDIRGLSRNSRYDIGCYEKATMYYYVNNASTNNTPNGLSWTTPYKTIQDALDMYNANDSTQIWVAAGAGNYLPSKNSSGTSSTGNDATFVLKPNLGLYGGFAGTPGTEPTNDADAITKINARLLKQYPTTIASNTTASTNLIKYSSTLGSQGVIVDGFTITGAGSGDYAVVLDNAKIQNCKIISNAGGGLSLNNGSNAFNILVANNGNLGVLFAGTPNNASVINATIVNNTGAALSSSSTSPTVKNAIIWNNGGGNISGSTPTISNSAGTSSYGTVTWPSGAGNIDLAERTPNFKNPSAKNYELLLISPCLDNGDATANSLPKDLNGNPRKYSSKVDMGAFQKWDGITIDGSYSSYSIKNIRKGYAVPISKLTASNDTTEVLITKGTKFDMGGSTNLRVKWLEIKDSTVVNSSLNPPMIANGSITADSVLYVRTFPLYVTGSTTVHAWNFFGVPYPVSVGKLEGATPETSVRIQQYSESTRAANGANKSAWNNLSTASLLNVGTGYSLNLNANKLPFRQTIIFPSNGGPVTLSSSGSVDVSGLSYTTTGTQS